MLVRRHLSMSIDNKGFSHELAESEGLEVATVALIDQSIQVDHHDPQELC